MSNVLLRVSNTLVSSRWAGLLLSVSVTAGVTPRMSRLLCQRHTHIPIFRRISRLAHGTCVALAM